jgi:hypothetical protein
METTDKSVFIDKDTFKQIFRDHWDEFKAKYPRYDTEAYDKILNKMLDCGDPDKMGYAQYRCLGCGETRRIAFSCKSSFCLSCAKTYTDRWVDFISRRLVPGVTYRHIVLTMPDFLKKWFYRNRSLLDTFIQTGYTFLKDIFRKVTGVDLDIGAIIVLQTFGRSGRWNPHLHILVTAGGITPEGKWKAVKFIPYEMMHRKWQYHLLTMLRENVSDPAINKNIDRGWKEYRKGFVTYLQPGDVPPGGGGLARYIAKYVVSPPISIRRIENYNGKTVSYWYRDHKTETIEHISLPVLTFMGRMVQHILPKGFQRIRYFGVHSNPRYAKMREIIGKMLPTDAPPDPKGYRVAPPRPFRERLKESFGKDPRLCPRCGQNMHLELIYHPDYGNIKEYTLWSETFNAKPTTREATAPMGKGDARGNALGAPKRVGKVYLQLLLPCGLG